MRHEFLLVGAYALIWLVLFFYVLLLLRRQRGLERDIRRLEAMLAAPASPSPATPRHSGREPAGS